MAQRRWSIDQDVREDAESVFVPAERLPRAAVGDVVQFNSEHVGTRSGQVTDLVDDDERGTFFTVRLDGPEA